MPTKPLPRFSDIHFIVFDLDGTLVDTFQDIAAAANDSLRQLGRPTFDPADIMTCVGHGGRNLMLKLLRRVMPDGAEPSTEEAQRAFEGWRDYYKEHPADRARPYPGVIDALAALRRRDMRMAVFSNKLHVLTDTIIRRLDMAQYFDIVLGEVPGAPLKPDPALLQDMMRQCGVSPEQTLVVGDGVADMQVAANAGVRAVGVDYGVTPTDELIRLGAVCVLSSFVEILNIV